MHTVYVNVGCNIGDKCGNIKRALDLISRSFGITCLSEVVESEPWGFVSDHRFINLGVAFRSEQEPEEILRKLQEIESQVSPKSHRDAQGYYIDREIDLDLMAIDELEYHSPILELPHPRMNQREFFLKPMAELAPGWKDPLSGKSIKAILCDFYQDCRHGFSAF